jgi:hypothetical protein
MKTRGIVVESGYLCAESRTAAWGLVPAPLWNRLKHAAQRAGLLEAFDRDAEPAREAQRQNDYAAERRLFEDWHLRLGFIAPAGHYPGQELWPWTRGWTEELVDSYLTAPSGRVEA